MATTRAKPTNLVEPVGDKMVALARAAADGFRSLSLAAGGGSVEDVGGALCWYSSSYVPVFNGAAIISEDLINEATLGAIASYFAKKRRPHSLMTLDGLVPDARRLLASHGYFEYDWMPGMWLEMPPRGVAEPPAGLEMSSVTSLDALITYRSLLGQIFHIPRGEIELVLGPRALKVPNVRHYLGRLDGVPVATTSLVLSEVAGIWNVGTLPEYTRRGIGTAMMRHALTEAGHLGYSSSILLASHEGVPLYTRLGYTTLSMVRVFVPNN